MKGEKNMKLFNNYVIGIMKGEIHPQAETKNQADVTFRLKWISRLHLSECCKIGTSCFYIKIKERNYISKTGLRKIDDLSDV